MIVADEKHILNFMSKIPSEFNRLIEYEKIFSIKTERMMYISPNTSSPPLYNVPKRGSSYE